MEELGRNFVVVGLRILSNFMMGGLRNLSKMLLFVYFDGLGNFFPKIVKLGIFWWWDYEFCGGGIRIFCGGITNFWVVGLGILW